MLQALQYPALVDVVREFFHELSLATTRPAAQTGCLTASYLSVPADQSPAVRTKFAESMAAMEPPLAERFVAAAGLDGTTRPEELAGSPATRSSASLVPLGPIPAEPRS
jgi:hypothetical protein